TRSFASSARNRSRSKFGIEKGLWEKSIFFSSSFHSYIGKSTIQQNSKQSFLERPRSLPIFNRAAPASVFARASLSAAKNTASPGLQPVRFRRREIASPERNFAIGPLPTTASPSCSKVM